MRIYALLLMLVFASLVVGLPRAQNVGTPSPVAKSAASGPTDVQKNGQTSSAAAPETAPATSASWKDQPEAVALREQNRLIKEYQSSLLDTVYWSLALLGAVVVLIVGASWLVNFKLYEADKDRIREELSSKTKEAQAELTAQIAAASNATLQALQVQLEGHADRVSKELLAIRSDFKGSLESMGTRLDDVKAASAAAVRQNGSLEKRISGVEATTRQVEELIWEVKGIPVNVLITQRQTLAAVVAGHCVSS